MKIQDSLRRASFSLLLLSALSTCAGAATEPSAETLRLFDYDAKAPLDVQVVSTEKRGTVTVQEITYASPKGGRVLATLMVPDGPGPFAGILLMHGMPGTRAVTHPEAETLAKRGAVTLAIDAPFSRSGGGTRWT